MNEFVRDGYERIAERYAADREEYHSLPYLERLAGLLPSGGHLLDIGCGAGLPAARFFIERGFSVTGIDISPRMVEMARANVLEAVFEVRDMTSLREGEYNVDGIAALYSVFHVSRDAHKALLRVLRSYLPEGGPVLLTMGSDEWEGTEPDFYGVEMFWSHYGPERNRGMLEAAGFSIESDELDTSGGERHQVLMGRATGSAGV